MSAVPIPKASAKPAEMKTEVANPSENARRGKLSEQAKYTDVKRTSSASFKPPMSKDNIAKLPIQPPPKDSSWFAPFSYIKTMFGSKSVPATAPTAGDKTSKGQQPANVNQNVKMNLRKDSGKLSKQIRDQELDTKTERAHSLGSDGREGNMSALVSNSNDALGTGRPKSPSFSISPHDAVSKRDVPKGVSNQKFDDDSDPNGLKYKQLQSVDNQSTYLHAPDKKGTTSFRITTNPKVGIKQFPTLLSPSFASQQQAQQKRAVKMNRKTSTSPHKSRLDSGSSRLRSKSTPDSSTPKSRPVSVSAIPKSIISLKNTSQKIASPKLDVKEIGSVVANARISKTSFSYNANKLRENISLSHPRNKTKLQRSPITINHTSTNAFAAHKTPACEESDIYSSVQNVSSSNSTLRNRVDPIPASPRLIRFAGNRKCVPPVPPQSPTFPTPSMPRPTQNKDSVIEKYQNAMLERKNKLKSKSQSSLTQISTEPEEDCPPPSVQNQQTPLFGSPSCVAISTEPILDNCAPVPDVHASFAKTITLCKAIKSDISFASIGEIQSSLSPKEFKPINLNHKVSKNPVVTIADKQEEPIETCTMTHPCIRMVNSSQSQPNHPTKPHVFNLSDRKQSSFTNLLVINKKDQLSESKETGELVNHGRDMSIRKTIENLNPSILVPSFVNQEPDDIPMVCAPSFYDASNNASSGLCLNVGGHQSVDRLLFDENLIRMNLCNSSNRNLTVTNDNESLPSNYMSENDDESIFGIQFGPSVLPPQDIIPVKISENEEKKLTECTSSKDKLKRKYPFDLQIDKILEQDSSRYKRSPTPRNKQPPVQETISPARLRGKSPNNTTYVHSGKGAYARKQAISQTPSSSTLQYLHSNVKMDTPTILEPSVSEKLKKVAVTKVASKANNINSLASTVGEAIGAITSAFQSSFMSMVSPTIKTSPSVSKAKPFSPNKPDVRETSTSPGRINSKIVHSSPPAQKKINPTKIVNEPLSATRSYVSSVLEDKGISKRVESSISTLKSVMDDDKDKKKDQNENHAKANLKKSKENLIDNKEVSGGKKRIQSSDRDDNFNRRPSPYIIEKPTNEVIRTDSSDSKLKSTEPEFKTTKISDEVEMDKTLTDKIKSQPITSSAITTDKSFANAPEGKDLEKVGENIFKPLIIQDKKPKKVKSPSIKRHKYYDPDAFTPNKSSMGEL